jgi:uncharacterized protein (TIGR00369 family)
MSETRTATVSLAAADLSALAQAVTDYVPLNRHLGVRVTELTAERAVAVLPAADETGNHVGTVHAAAIFLVAEAAAGAAFVAGFAAALGEIRFVMRHAQMDYLKPARGEIRAVARVPAAVDLVRPDLAADGRTEVTITATVSDDADRTVATLIAGYHVSPARTAASASRS